MASPVVRKIIDFAGLTVLALVLGTDARTMDQYPALGDSFGIAPR